MKKLISIIAMASFIFASNSDDINKKLDLILQKMYELEKKVENRDKQIEKLKKELKESQQKIQMQVKKEQEKQKKELKNRMVLSSCKNISVSNFSYKYHDNVIPYYTLTYTLTNNYPKKIVHLKGDLIIEDKDEVKILQDYIDRDVNLAPGESITIKKVHTFTNDMEHELANEKPENLKLIFEVIRADLEDGGRVECGIF
jgi:ABC-type Fe3+-citrate transport system substrate-binding protein